MGAEDKAKQDVNKETAATKKNLIEQREEDVSQLVD